MDHYLFSMCLAEDIMECVLKSRKIEWEARNRFRLFYKGELPERIVTLFLEKAVLKFIEESGKLLIDILEDYTNNNNAPTVHDFCRYTIEVGSEMFKNGFDPLIFIKYSAIVADMACRLYDHNRYIPEHAVGVIGTILVSQMMTGQFEDSGGQEGLKARSFEFLNWMSKKVKKQP